MSAERKGLSTFQILILIGNLAFVGIVVVYFVMSGVGQKTVKPLFEEAFLRVAGGRVENDEVNRLVLRGRYQNKIRWL